MIKFNEYKLNCICLVVFSFLFFFENIVFSLGQDWGKLLIYLNFYYIIVVMNLNLNI